MVISCSLLLFDPENLITEGQRTPISPRVHGEGALPPRHVESCDGSAVFSISKRTVRLPFKCVNLDNLRCCAGNTARGPCRKIG